MVNPGLYKQDSVRSVQELRPDLQSVVLAARVLRAPEPVGEIAGGADRLGQEGAEEIQHGHARHRHRAPSVGASAGDRRQARPRDRALRRRRAVARGGGGQPGAVRLPGGTAGDAAHQGAAGCARWRLPPRSAPRCSRTCRPWPSWASRVTNRRPSRACWCRRERRDAIVKKLYAETARIMALPDVRQRDPGNGGRRHRELAAGVHRADQERSREVEQGHPDGRYQGRMTGDSGLRDGCSCSRPFLRASSVQFVLLKSSHNAGPTRKPSQNGLRHDDWGSWRDDNHVTRR